MVVDTVEGGIDIRLIRAADAPDWRAPFTALRHEELVEESAAAAVSLAVARAELAVKIGAAPGASIRVRRTRADPAPNEPSAGAPLPDAPSLEEQALAHRGDLEALRLEHEAARQALVIEQATSGFWPGFLQPGAEGDSRGRSLGLSAGFELPLGDSDDARLAVAEARVREARAACMAALQSVRHEVVSTRSAWNEARRRRTRHLAAMEPLLAQIDDVAHAMLAAGELDAMGLLALERQRLDSRRAAVRAWLFAESARVAFALASGTPASP